MDKSITCCFTGHRHIEHFSCHSIQQSLKTAVKNLIDEGYQNFISGGALGFDQLAAETVLNFKKKHPHIRLIMVLPCLEQEKFWTNTQKKKYYAILSAADKIIYTSEHYFKGCMFQRNRYLVDSASCVLAYLERDAGGTKYTVDYAEKTGAKIRYLHPEPCWQVCLFS